MRKYRKRILWRFDRSFSSNKVWKPVLWVLGFCVVWTLALWLVALIWKSAGIPEGAHPLDDVISLVIGQSNYPMEKSTLPHWYQLLVAMVGTMFFTAFLISMFSNILMNRAASHRKGFLHYYFENHVLILGGSSMVVGLLKSIAADEQLRKKDVVILSNKDAEELWVKIVPLLTNEERKVSLTIYHGERNMDKALLFSQVELASVIYIIGEDEEKEHDSINMDCWQRVGKIRGDKAKTDAQCYLSFERNASTYLFHAMPEEPSTAKMETTIFNRLESVAQQILIGDDYKWKGCTLDREGIGAESKQYVHFVVVGMTQMGFSMASTAAHLCHFPNFKENAYKPIRTKITFIDPDADREMKLVKGRYAGLFELSHSVYREEGKASVEEKPKEEYGDFLDVEWEFIKGLVVDNGVRAELEKWRQDKEQILTVAFCGDEPERNIAQAMYLPRGFYSLMEKDYSKPVILVYQPVSDAMLRSAQEVERYKNIHPFGNISDCFDKNLNHRVAAGKRINFLYKKEDNEEKYVMMPYDEADLDALWRKLSFAEKMSNIYAANSIYSKLRSEGMDWQHLTSSDLEEEVVERLARLEHARWNMEKLLVGFCAMPTKERDDLNARLDSSDPQVKAAANVDKNDYKNKEFMHKDIAPYGKLPKKSKAYDRAIVRNVKDVIINLNQNK